MILWTLLAFTIIVAFAGLICSSRFGWNHAGCPRRICGAVQAGEQRVSAYPDKPKANCRTNIDPRCCRDWAGLARGGRDCDMASGADQPVGQITDRLTHAIDQLGNWYKVDVRIGSIYALERLVKDSAVDRVAIGGEILAAFMQLHAHGLRASKPPGSASHTGCG